MATLELLDASSVWSDQNHISASGRNQYPFNSVVQIVHFLEKGREVKETEITGSPEKYMFKHVNMISLFHPERSVVGKGQPVVKKFWIPSLGHFRPSPNLVFEHRNCFSKNRNIFENWIFKYLVYLTT